MMEKCIDEDSRDRVTSHQYHYHHRHQTANVAPIIINLRCTDQVFVVPILYTYIFVVL